MKQRINEPTKEQHDADNVTIDILETLLVKTEEELVEAENLCIRIDYQRRNHEYHIQELEEKLEEVLEEEIMDEEDEEKAALGTESCDESEELGVDSDEESVAEFAEEEEVSEVIAESKSEDEFLCNSLSEDYSTEVKDATALHQKIDKLEYQNQVNIQRLYELECADEKKSVKLRDNEKWMMKYEQENEELKKELEMKKKFVFRM